MKIIRPLSGIASTAVLSMVCPRPPVVRSRSDASARTSTNSEMSPTSSLASTVTCWPTSTVTPDRMNVLNPLRLTSTRYFPGLRNGAAYAPSACVNTSDRTFVSSLVTITVM